MAIRLTIPFMLLLCIGALAQNKKIDSLLRILPSLNGTNRIDCLNELGFEYSNPFWNSSHKVKLDTAFKYILPALQESQQMHYAEGIAMAKQSLGMVEEERGNFIQSEEYTQYAIDHLINTAQKKEYHRAIVNLAWCAMLRGRPRQAINILTGVLPNYQALQDTLHIAMLYRMISKSYLFLGSSSQAFEYYQKNALFSNSTGDVFGQILSPQLKAYLYLIAGDTTRAIVYYRQSAEIARMEKDEEYYLNYSNIFKLTYQYDSAIYYANENNRFTLIATEDSLTKINVLMQGMARLANLYFLHADYDKAIQNSIEPLRFFYKTGDIYTTLGLWLTLAQVYEKKKDKVKAKYYLTRLLDLAEKTGSRTHMLKGYNMLWQLNKDLGLVQPAYQYLLKYVALKDSIDQDNYKVKIAAWDAITQITENERNYARQIKITEEINNERIATVNKEKRQQLIIFIALTIICLLFAAFVIRSIRLKRKKDQLQLLVTETNAQLEKRKAEQSVAELQLQKTAFEMQALRAQMNPHFIFNCLSSINRYILTNDMESASEYLTKFSRLIRMALQHSEEPMITLESELEMIRLYLELEQLRFKNVFDYTISFINTLDTSAVFIPPMLLQPFAENAIWHGLMHKAGQGHLEITLSVERKILTCTITDNGIGRRRAAILKTKSVEKNKAMGIRINAERLSLMNRPGFQESACIIEDLRDKEGNDCGTKVILKVKYNDLVEAYA